MKLHLLMTKRKFILLIILGINFSCSQKTERAIDQHPYFDLAAYFQQKAKHLEELHPVVQKTVGKNDQLEQKKINIADWLSEFELFISSDINKPDWSQSYSVDSSTEKIAYHSKDSKLRTKKILINKNENGSIKHIHIVNSEENWLYQSLEILDYYPDSIYQIDKKQSIRIIGNNRYKIEGLLIP